MPKLRTEWTGLFLGVADALRDAAAIIEEDESDTAQVVNVEVQLEPGTWATLCRVGVTFDDAPEEGE